MHVGCYDIIRPVNAIIAAVKGISKPLAEGVNHVENRNGSGIESEWYISRKSFSIRLNTVAF